nr:hypothetical protein [Ralstonia syzygii]
MHILLAAGIRPIQPQLAKRIARIDQRKLGRARGRQDRFSRAAPVEPCKIEVLAAATQPQNARVGQPQRGRLQVQPLGKRAHQSREQIGKRPMGAIGASQQCFHVALLHKSTLKSKPSL